MMPLGVLDQDLVSQTTITAHGKTLFVSAWDWA